MHAESENSSEIVTPEVVPVALDRLLVEMHAAAYRLVDSKLESERVWGKHLLEDWRSLELLAMRHRP
jgi:hypothetical protein